MNFILILILVFWYMHTCTLALINRHFDESLVEIAT